MGRFRKSNIVSFDSSLTLAESPLHENNEDRSVGTLRFPLFQSEYVVIPGQWTCESRDEPRHVAAGTIPQKGGYTMDDRIVQ